jgi:hypothetical protein
MSDIFRKDRGKISDSRGQRGGRSDCSGLAGGNSLGAGPFCILSVVIARI